MYHDQMKNFRGSSILFHVQFWKCGIIYIYDVMLAYIN